MEYRTSKHSKFLILYHIILVCKYRHKILIELGEQVKNLLIGISKECNFIIESMEVDKDHLHILINCSPEHSPKSIIILIKKLTTYRLWNSDPSISKYLRKFYWTKNKLWSEGSFICTIGNASNETIRKYIESQG